LNPVTYARSLERTALQNGWEIHQLSPIKKWKRPWLHLPGKSASAPSLYISTGIHGDEPAGTWAALELISRPRLFRGFAVVLIPLINPSGLKLGTRENEDGIDLNRDYRRQKTAEIRGHIKVLRSLGPFKTHLCLHEDYETTGVYLHEIAKGRSRFGRMMLKAMSVHIPIEKAREIDGFINNAGLLFHDQRKLKRQRPDWPEVYYLVRHHTPFGYTIETPSALPLKRRVKAQVAAVKYLVAKLRKRNRSN
jgi:murein peptide amidase A